MDQRVPLPGETWTVRELAKHVDLSESTVRRLVADHLIPHQPAGWGTDGRWQRLRFTAADVEAMASGQPAAEIQNRRNWRAVNSGLREFGPDMWAQPSVTVSASGQRTFTRHLPPQPIFELADATAARRAARKRLEDARAKHGQRSKELQRPRKAYEAATDRWVGCLRAAAAAGYPARSLSGTAGVSVAAVVNRLRQAT